MDRTGKLIVVQGATGQQGGVVARHLLADGWPVRALTRDPQKPAAQALAALGAEVVQADNDDRASLEAAVSGAYGVFSVQNNWLPNVGVDGEVRQGKLIADVASAAGVRHFVYSSVGGAERDAGVPHFESKWQIEQHIAALGLPATIVRPVAFMDNYNWARLYILNGIFSGMGLRADKTLQLIAADDIGAFVALVFSQPERFMGQAVELAGDELTESQIAETLARVIGRPVNVSGQGMGDNGEEGRRMVAWFNEAGYEADIPALRALLPGLRTLETWLHETGWENAPAPDLSQAPPAWGS